MPVKSQNKSTGDMYRVAATPSTILLSSRALQIYVRSNLSANYYGIANGRVEWKTHTKYELQNPTHGVVFPDFGECAGRTLNGKSGKVAEFGTMRCFRNAVAQRAAD